ncbi:MULTISPECIES: VOC family protein [unclassified Streptomyces]|uniref:VOC family protein n=1 Tax=unclassified Streptomyces TaxID=2593676 RepID=UPI001F048EA0|nr:MULTISPECIES: VOC family protein [unclassified Streptomyces]MCH0564376.1 VOC family protein [Streptomyces sp. MUM 2J]MCH0569548.1 VOC family protein [Streptomyces sp. MUM 136J]
MAVAELGTVVVDCPAPRALAAFWAQVLGGTVEADPGQAEWVDVKVPGGQALAFQAAPGFVPPEWPSPGRSQQFHLDLTVDDLDAAEQRVLELDARPLETEDRSRTWRVYADPNALDLPF